MEYPVGKYDLDGLISACSEVMPAGLAYDVVGVELEDLLESEEDPADIVKDQILNHGECIFLLCHGPSNGKTYKFADGTKVAPFARGDSGPVLNSEGDLLGVEVHVKSGTIYLKPSSYDVTFAQVFSLSSFTDDDENEFQRDFCVLMQEKIEVLISSFAKGSG